MSFFSELKRRNVFRVGVAYAVSAWVLLQIVDLVLENINAPDWVMQAFMLAMAVGFPISLIIAWAFEVTPDGVKLAKDVDKSKSIARQTGQQLNRNIIVALSVAIVFLLTDRFRDDLFSSPDGIASNTQQTDSRETEAEQPENSNSIAVLPFRDMSAKKDQAYFGEGIAEELLNALVKLDGLHVASRTSTFSLADEDLDIPAIAERLGVEHILEGSIRTSGNQVRVTAQLIEVSNDVHLWSETYDGTLDDIFKIQDEITGKITRALKVQLGGEELTTSSELLTNNAEAYQLYLRGRHLWRQRNSVSINQAIRLFEEAVTLDPEFHRAWSNLAVAYVNQADYDRSVTRESAFQNGLKAADRALEINPQSTEALIIKANYAEIHCNVSEAARLYQKAIEINPEDPTVRHWYAILLNTAGRLTRALEEIQTARRIDPLISAVMAIEAEILRNKGEYAQSAALYQTAADLGLYGGSPYNLGMIALYQGQIEKAKPMIVDGWPGQDQDVVEGMKLFLEAIESPESQKAFEEFIGKAGPAKPFNTADNIELLVILGSDYVFEYVENIDCPTLDTSIWSELFRQQRTTAEFFELMQRTGHVDYWLEFGWPDDCASLDQNLAECP